MLIPFKCHFCLTGLHKQKNEVPCMMSPAFLYLLATWYRLPSSTCWQHDIACLPLPAGNMSPAFLYLLTTWYRLPSSTSWQHDVACLPLPAGNMMAPAFLYQLATWCHLPSSTCWKHDISCLPLPASNITYQIGQVAFISESYKKQNLQW